jgi:hypothetical protein
MRLGYRFMRRFVRYAPLGRNRQVMLHRGVHDDARAAEIVDESLRGFGLRLLDASGLEVGQRVTIENHKGTFPANIVRIEPCRDGGFVIGLEFLK